MNADMVRFSFSPFEVNLIRSVVPEPQPLPEPVLGAACATSLGSGSDGVRHFIRSGIALAPMAGLRNERGNIAVVLLALVLVAFLAGPLVLHFGQNRHNQLDFDIDAAYPPNQEFVPGEIFASTLLALMEQELGGFTGWRPNDFFLWGPGLWADNNANRQLGIIQAMRESTRVFKDHLTKVSATEYDPNLVEADTMLRNDARKFWFPSAESRFQEGVKALRRYLNGLHAKPPKSKTLNRRNVELIRLFQTWSDLLGDAHANLFKSHEADGGSVPTWRTDDYFYHAQGFTHVMHHLSRALRREYAGEVGSRATVAQLLDEVIDALGRAAVLKPLIVLDGSPAGLFANHRRNLDGYVVEARQKMYSIREELEK
jgi:hypothetical protein